MSDHGENPPGGTTSNRHGRRSHHGNKGFIQAIQGSLVAGVAALTGMEVENDLTIDSRDPTMEEVLVPNNTTGQTGNTNKCTINNNNIQTDIRHVIIKCSSETNADSFRNLDA